MKTKIIFLLSVLFSAVSLAQNFPGKDVQLLVGKDLKVLPKAEVLQKYGYADFYTNEKLKTKFACCESYNSKYVKLVSKVFKVLSFEPYTDIIGSEKFKLKIENEETGVLYFDYSPMFEHSFPFEVIGGLNFEDGYYCKDIEMRADKFTGDTTFTTPVADGVSFVKVKRPTGTDFYLSINETGSTLNVGKKGLILLLENNLRIEKPSAEIDVKPSKYSGYIYSAFVTLTDADIKLLTKNAITDNRLYIYDGTVKYGKKLIDYLNCIIQK